MAQLSAAASHVGKVRANNQDSAYAGAHLFVVADGMGGHAGGDVASAIAVKRITDTDRAYDTVHDAELALRSALLAANAELAETVFEHGELTGMGTTVSGILRVEDKIALAHIGDSRVYLHRDGELKQISSDHTFVQRLVDSGRITPEEAAVHPRRSVLMRVLGDVDASPEIDTAVFDTRIGDRWLLCSDGLSSYVSDEKIAAILESVPDPEDAANRLIKESLDEGAPDNVTVVLVDIDDTVQSSHVPPITVGSAASPLVFDTDSIRRPLRLPTLLLHPLKATQTDDSHFEPESDDYLDVLMVEDHRRRRRRRVWWLVTALVVLAAVAATAIIGYQFTQTHYYVGSSDGRVAIYQGVQQDLGPILLSHLVEQTSIELAGLTVFDRQSVLDTISTSTLADAQRVVSRLTADQKN